MATQPHTPAGREGDAGGRAVAALLVIALAGSGMAAGAADLVVIGAVEDVALPAAGVTLPARVDTGAAKSSLAARELSVKDRVAQFRLPEEYGTMLLRMRVVSWVNVHSNLGTERRPVVEMDLCVGSKRLHTRVNLDDRAGLKFPLLIGRNTLEGNFLVDVQRQHTAPPHCPAQRP
ncbi:MAG: hypothetical protein AUK49_11510 [Betaproteobacteria bacterium CG2_30_68_42]|nr:MAG: hypothetical protein AUK49_11510 [Betaproteobacteria bacterium CG2_30_68_42]